MAELRCLAYIIKLLSLLNVRTLSNIGDKVDVDVQLLLHIECLSDVLMLNEQNVEAVLTFAGSTPGPMDESLLIIARALDDDIDVIDVKSTSCNICTHKNVLRARLSELIKRLFSLRLVHIAMDWKELCKIEILKVSCLLLRLGEDHNLLVLVRLDKVLDLLKCLLEVLCYHCLVLELIRKLVLVVADEVNHHRVGHTFLSNVLDESGDRC